MKKLLSFTLCSLLYSQMTFSSQGNIPDRISTQAMLNDATIRQKGNCRFLGFYTAIAAYCLYNQRPIEATFFAVLSAGFAWNAKQEHKNIIQLQTQNEALENRYQKHINQQQSS